MLDRMQLIEGPARSAARPWWSFPVAASVHLGLLGFAAAVSMVAVTAVSDPDNLVPITWSPPTVPIGGSSGGGGKTQARPNPRPPAPRPPSEPVQPVAVAPLAEATTPSDADRDESGIAGLPPGEGFGSGGDGLLPCPDGNCGDGPGILPGPPAEQDPEEPLIVNGRIEPPVLIDRVEPGYPETARRARVEGKVTLQAVIAEDGGVESVRVLRSHPLLDEAAVSAVQRWKYRPARLDGQPVRVYFTVIVTFRLE